jgi:hypothetical protein
VLQDIKRSNSAVGRRSFRSLLPLDARFCQNVWEFGTRNRVPKYVWLSDGCQGVTYRWFDATPDKRLRLWDKRVTTELLRSAS